MKKIFVMFLVVVGFVFAVNNMVMAGPAEPRTIFQDTDLEYPVVDVFYVGTERGGIGVSGAAIDATAIGTYGVFGTSLGIDSTGVMGYSGGTGTTYGVYGTATSSRGIGVRGEAPNTGVWGESTGPFSAGVYGKTTSGSGYGIISEGNAKVFGNLEVTGNLVLTGTISKDVNLASSAYSCAPMAMADSEYNSNYSADKAIDGIIAWDAGEWASMGKGITYYRSLTQASIEDGDSYNDRAWIQLYWSSPQNINVVKLYDRPNRFDKILDAWLLVERMEGGISIVSNLHLGMFPYGGAPKIVYLTREQGTNVQSMKLTINEVGPDTLNVGISEWECFFDASRW